MDYHERDETLSLCCPAFHHLYAAAFRRRRGRPPFHELVKDLEICARFTVSKELRRLQS
jgi:hypothetical protein